MISRLRRWLSSFRPAKNTSSQSQQPPADPYELVASRPLSLDAQLDIANRRATEQQIRSNIREGLRRYREAAADNPGSLWALSIVDPYDWAMDTPAFYPGLASGMGGWGVPWMLNNQGRGDVLPVYINEYGLKLIRDWSRKILAFNEFAINAVENRISYIVGEGFQYTVLPKKKPGEQALGGESGAEPSGMAAKAQAVLDEFVSRERWSEREQECVKRCDRDGEAILRFFHVGGGRTSVRFVEPEYMTDQSGLAQNLYGVNCDSGDIEDVQSYSIVENPRGPWVTEEVPAAEILHIKLNTDFDAKRGLPTLFPVRKNLERADKLLRNMSIMGQVQATFAVIRKHEGFSPSTVSAYQQNLQDTSAVSPMSGKSLSIQQLRPGSVIDSSKKTEYEFPSAGVNASGLVAVLQAELRAIAARMVMPEWMLTVDASNGNFAGQLVSGAPSVEKFKRDQAFFARRFGDGQYGRQEIGERVAGAMWRVLAIAVEGGLLPRETLTDLEIQAEGPSITVVNKSAETIRARTLYEAGLLSLETWGKWEGLDYEQEKALGAKPQPKAPAPGPGGGGVPASAPPGSAKGGASEQVNEDFTGMEKDSLGRNICYQNGKRVACAGGEKGGRDRYVGAGKKDTSGLAPQTPKGSQEASRRHLARLVEEGASVKQIVSVAIKHEYGPDIATEAALASALSMQLASGGSHGFDLPGKFAGLPVLFDAKHSAEMNGYHDKTQHKLGKIREWKQSGGIPAYLVVAEGHGVYLHVGIDPAQSARFGGGKHKRRVIAPEEWNNSALSGTGEPLPFVKVSDAKGLIALAKATPEQLEAMKKNVASVIKRIDMDKMKKHVEAQIKLSGVDIGQRAAKAGLTEPVLTGILKAGGAVTAVKAMDAQLTDEQRAEAVKAMAKKLTDEQRAEAVTTMAKKLTKEQRAELRRMLDEEEDGK